MGTKPKVLVTRVIPQDGLRVVSDTCDAVIRKDDLPPSRDELLDLVRGMNGILALLSDRIDGEVMDAAGEQLTVISNYAVGFDNIDVAAATERGIFVANTPGTVTESTADLTFALLLAAARRIGEGIDYIRTGHWVAFKPMELLGKDVHHATLGIIGLGSIGLEVAKRARGFDMDVIYYDHHMRAELGRPVGAVMCDSFDELLSRSDFITIHAPLTDATQGLINAEVLSKMKKTAILVNASRGPVVDTDALYDALQSGRIAYAALDVTDPEPLSADHKLMELPNCLIVPHVGSASVATRTKMAVLAAENLVAGATGGVPRHLVNPEVSKRRQPG
ncbi:MAG TPA: D-glycerate dehydrogenase [Deltaproteobacteria bacterium]|nr:D-glycerate dehydrogenase [Deltaproteobacteria bacterium]